MKVLQTKKFKKDRNKLSKDVTNRLIERINILLTNPRNPLLNNHNLNAPWKGSRSINISGGIRLIYTEEDSIYLLQRVGSHSQLYS